MSAPSSRVFFDFLTLENETAGFIPFVIIDGLKVTTIVCNMFPY
jgi:hypothetical protein